MSAIGRKGGMGAHISPEPLADRASHNGYSPELEDRRVADARR
jgi:hypothetical protein